MKLYNWLPVFHSQLLECDCEENSIEEGKSLEDYTFDYADFRDRVAKACVIANEKAIKELLGLNIKLTFDDIEITRSGGCRCEIIMNLSEKTYQKVVNRLTNKKNKESFETFCKETFASYDGYTSFVPNNSTAVLTILNTKSEYFESVFYKVIRFLLNNEGFNVKEVSLDDNVSAELNYVSATLK
jgi:hypothetical protein